MNTRILSRVVAGAALGGMALLVAPGVAAADDMRHDQDHGKDHHEVKGWIYTDPKVVEAGDTAYIVEICKKPQDEPGAWSEVTGPVDLKPADDDNGDDRHKGNNRHEGHEGHQGHNGDNRHNGDHHGESRHEDRGEGDRHHEKWGEAEESESRDKKFHHEDKRFHHEEENGGEHHKKWGDAEANAVENGAETNAVDAEAGGDYGHEDKKFHHKDDNGEDGHHHKKWDHAEEENAAEKADEADNGAHAKKGHHKHPFAYFAEVKIPEDTEPGVYDLKGDCAEGKLIVKPADGGVDAGDGGAATSNPGMVAGGAGALAAAALGGLALLRRRTADGTLA